MAGTASSVRQIEWVQQQHQYGCMAAVCAMLLGTDYLTAAGMMTNGDPDRFEHSATSYFLLESILVNHGYAVARKYKVTQPGNQQRETWPVEPWSDVHWCEVMAGASSGYAHAVVLLRDGSVIDPMHAFPRRLSDYEAVNFIAAVVPVL